MFPHADSDRHLRLSTHPNVELQRCFECIRPRKICLTNRFHPTHTPINSISFVAVMMMQIVDRDTRSANGPFTRRSLHQTCYTDFLPLRSFRVRSKLQLSFQLCSIYQLTSPIHIHSATPFTDEQEDLHQSIDPRSPVSQTQNNPNQQFILVRVGQHCSSVTYSFYSTSLCRIAGDHSKYTI